MSFQAYIDNIRQKTGKSPEDFKQLAAEKGLLEKSVKTRQIIDWLKEDFGLGHGHAMAIVTSFKSNPDGESSTEDRIDAHFTGNKERWRPVFDGLLRQVSTFGDDFNLKGGGTYITLLKKDKKFAIIVVGTAHLDIGIKLKAVDPTDRFVVAGNWNAMVTHRVRVTSQDEVDTELIEWLRRAYLEVPPIR